MLASNSASDRQLRSLLIQSQENYRRVKRKYEELRELLLRDRNAMKEEKVRMASKSKEIQRRSTEMESLIRAKLDIFADEQSQREKLFCDFKSTTVAQITAIYEKQIVMMAGELKESHKQIEALVDEVGRLHEVERRMASERRTAALAERMKESELVKRYEDEIFQLRQRAVEVETNAGRAENPQLGLKQ